MFRNNRRNGSGEWVEPSADFASQLIVKVTWGGRSAGSASQLMPRSPRAGGQLTVKVVNSNQPIGAGEDFIRTSHGK